MYGYNLVSEEKNSIWKIVVTDDSLKNKDGSVKAKVKAIAEIVDDVSNDLWDIIYYKDMVAFKLPIEHKTYIYSKLYWNARCGECFDKLKVLRK
ncbi:hypothetical protein [Clostridium gasigenes]|uniref:hypothetical protein n=1 Tax=Clostridium gasigenes TaxID=94869 RepID=UPI001C0DCEAF|nr:hypothetical protein [Clostridium gasigenes]MBU3107155.1 hypothetical protein [Clostridium gasigenes]